MRKTVLTMSALALAATLAGGLLTSGAALASDSRTDRSDDRAGERSDDMRADDMRAGEMQAGTEAPRSEWMTIGAVAAKLEAEGYRVREIDSEHGIYEVEAIAPDGRRVEAAIDPVTGEPIRGWEND